MSVFHTTSEKPPGLALVLHRLQFPKQPRLRMVVPVVLLSGYIKREFSDAQIRATSVDCLSLCQRWDLPEVLLEYFYVPW